MSKNPEVRIYFAELLYDMEARELAGERQLKTVDEYIDKVVQYRKSWDKHEGKIIPAMQQALGVEFYRDVLDVAVAPYFVPKSSPLIMNTLHDPDHFVDVLAHELTHVLLTDNNKVQTTSRNPQLWPIDNWREMYGGEYDFNTLCHIPVHALAKYLYLDVLEDESRYERDKESVKGWEGSQAYIDAWQYVDDRNYMEIIADLKQMYAEVET